MGGTEELNKFLETPENFVPPLAPKKLPPSEMLPRRRTAAEAKAMFPKAIELQGYCPVTYLDGKCRWVFLIRLRFGFVHLLFLHDINAETWGDGY